MNIADILDRAADLIEPDGAWSGGSSCTGPYCASTAIDEASPTGSCNRGQMFFARYLGLRERRGPGGRISIWNWNDAPGRTQAEVVAKLREAATLAREGITHGEPE